MNQLSLFRPLILNVLYCVYVGALDRQNDTTNNYYNSTDLQTYKKLFSMRRQQHKEVVVSINFLDGVKQGKFVIDVVEQALKIIHESKLSLLNASYMVIEGELDQDYEIRKSLSNILEYTLLCGDLVLYFPKLTHYAIAIVAIKPKALPTKDIYANKGTNNFILKWAINISNATKLLGPKDTETLWLMSQELGYAQRDPRYINPYALSYEELRGEEGKGEGSPGKTKRKQTKTTDQATMEKRTEL